MVFTMQLDKKLKKIIYYTITIIITVLITIIGARASEGIEMFNNDNPIMIYETVEDQNGNPCDGCIVNLTLYNEVGTINTSYLMEQLTDGLYNQTLGILSVGFYPMKIFANKSNFTGTSDKVGIKVVDELPSDFKDQIDDTKSLLEYINESYISSWNNTFYYWNGTLFARFENNFTQIATEFITIQNNFTTIWNNFNCTDLNYSLCFRLRDINTTLNNMNLSIDDKIDSLDFLLSEDYIPTLGGGDTFLLADTEKSNKMINQVLPFMLSIIILLLIFGILITIRLTIKKRKDIYS